MSITVLIVTRPSFGATIVSEPGLGDGDTFMSVKALWIAERYNIPALFVLDYNRCYYNDWAALARRRAPAPVQPLEPPLFVP